MFGLDPQFFTMTCSSKERLLQMLFSVSPMKVCLKIVLVQLALNYLEHRYLPQLLLLKCELTQLQIVSNSTAFVRSEVETDLAQEIEKEARHRDLACDEYLVVTPYPEGRMFSRKDQFILVGFNCHRLAFGKNNSITAFVVSRKLWITRVCTSITNSSFVSYVEHELGDTVNGRNWRQSLISTKQHTSKLYKFHHSQYQEELLVYKR